VNKNDFEYKYQAPTSAERREIESIRNSYLPKEHQSTKIDYMKKLDRKVKNIPFVVAVILGIVGLLIFGLGFSMVLEWSILLGGIVVSGIGVLVASIAYPVYIHLLKNMKNKYSEEILKLSEELLDDERK